MVAGILLFVVLVDCVLTWYLLARVKGYRGEVALMEDNNKAMADALRAAAAAMAGDARPVTLPSAGVPDADLVKDAKDVLANASPEELAQARQLLESLGL